MLKQTVISIFAGSITIASAFADSKIAVTHMGSMPTIAASSENFTGKAWIDSSFRRDFPARVGGGVVTFEPGARTAWHTHPLGQTLIVTSGSGVVQEWGEEQQSINPGDVVWIPPQVKHWHGASPTMGMRHIAIAELLDGRSVTWMEHVSNQQYQPKNEGTMK